MGHATGKKFERLKHIELDFCSDACVMPQGWVLGCPGDQSGISNCPRSGDLGMLGGQKLERGDSRWRPIECAF